MLRLAALSALVVTVAVAACNKDPGPQLVETAAPAGSAGSAGSAEVSDLAPLPDRDLVGYFSGSYKSGGNNPAAYLDRARKVLVLMGRSGISEVPVADPGAGSAYETFLLDNGYAANGKTAPDKHQRVTVGGQEMVVMSTDELFPEMPADLAAHFSGAQMSKLNKTDVGAGMDLVAAHTPVIWAYTHSLVVVGPGVAKQEMSIDHATEAFAAFRKLVDKK